MIQPVMVFISMASKIRYEIVVNLVKNVSHGYRSVGVTVIFSVYGVPTLIFLVTRYGRIHD